VCERERERERERESDIHIYQTALVDLEFLGGGDAMLGTVYSTFSFAAHARALITPHFSGMSKTKQISTGMPKRALQHASRFKYAKTRTTLPIKEP